MQNNNIEYLRKSLKKIKRYNLFIKINSYIIPWFLMIIVSLASQKNIGYELFVTIFLLLVLVNYFPKTMKSYVIETIDNSKEIMEIMKNCSNYSKEELDDCFFLISELIQIVNFGFIFITHLTLFFCLYEIDKTNKNTSQNNSVEVVNE